MTALRLSWLEEKRRGLIIIWFSPWRNQVEKLPSWEVGVNRKIRNFFTVLLFTVLLDSVNPYLSYCLSVSILVFLITWMCLPYFLTASIVVFLATWLPQSLSFVLPDSDSLLITWLSEFLTVSNLVFFTTLLTQSLSFLLLDSHNACISDYSTWLLFIAWLTPCLSLFGWSFCLYVYLSVCVSYL